MGIGKSKLADGNVLREFADKKWRPEASGLPTHLGRQQAESPKADGLLPESE